MPFGYSMSFKVHPYGKYFSNTLGDMYKILPTDIPEREGIREQTRRRGGTHNSDRNGQGNSTRRRAGGKPHVSLCFWNGIMTSDQTEAVKWQSGECIVGSGY